jgi:hypothetical protein
MSVNRPLQTRRRQPPRPPPPRPRSRSPLPDPLRLAAAVASEFAPANVVPSREIYELAARNRQAHTASRHLPRLWPLRANCRLSADRHDAAATRTSPHTCRAHVFARRLRPLSADRHEARRRVQAYKGNPRLITKPAALRSSLARGLSPPGTVTTQPRLARHPTLAVLMSLLADCGLSRQTVTRHGEHDSCERRYMDMPAARSEAGA